MKKDLDLDTLDAVNGGLDLRNLHPSTPGMSAPSYSADPFAQGGSTYGNPFAAAPAPSYGGSPFGSPSGYAPGGPVPAGYHPDPTHSNAFDPFGAPGHPTPVVDPYHQQGGGAFPAALPFSPGGYLPQQNYGVAPHPTAPQASQGGFNFNSVLGALPGLVNGLSSGNPTGILNAVGQATGTPGLGQIGGLLNGLTGGGNSGGNPLSSLGNLFGGGGSSNNGNQGGGFDFGGGDSGGGDFGGFF